MKLGRTRRLTLAALDRDLAHHRVRDYGIKHEAWFLLFHETETRLLSLYFACAVDRPRSLGLVGSRFPRCLDIFVVPRGGIDVKFGVGLGSSGGHRRRGVDEALDGWGGRCGCKEVLDTIDNRRDDEIWIWGER